MNTNSVFITGTDTDLGKTVVAAALLAIWRAVKLDIVPMKPIQTGCPEEAGKLISTDLRFCLKMAAMTELDAEYEMMEVYKFKHACSPHLAAAQAGMQIDFPPIIQAMQELQSRHDGVIVEGAGGVMVPIAGNLTMLDLMQALALPVILVTRPELGTINHTLLSLDQLRRAKLRVLGVIICQSQSMEWGMIEQNNLETIERLGKIKVLGRLPFMPGLNRGEMTATNFLQTVKESLYDAFK